MFDQRRTSLKQLCRALVAANGGQSDSDFSMSIILLMAVLFLRRFHGGGLSPTAASAVDVKRLYEEELSILLAQFPALDRFVDASDALPGALVQRLVSWVNGAAPPFDNLLAWAYQYLKLKREKEVYESSLKHGVKISGEDIASATQFFTEEYMVRYLVRNALRNVYPGQVDIRYFKLIDPACGGANFLLCAFEELGNRYARDPRAKQNVARTLLEHVLVGYEIDPSLALVACLSLYLKAISWGATPEGLNLSIYTSSDSKDQTGSLRVPTPAAPTVLRVSDGASCAYTDILKSDLYNVVITNPPFMGPRNMDTSLKDFLRSEYPQSKGDLCVAFFIRCLELVQPGGTLGLVNQTGWMFLKSFREWRETILANHQVLEIVDLGSNSFLDISGDKTSVALTLIRKEAPAREASLIKLKGLPLNQKSEMLESGQISAHLRFTVQQDSILSSADNAILYERIGAVETAFRDLPAYGEFATPMQGTSTGDHSQFIDYWWTHANDPEWVLVSKGGGYCKWSGLNYYKVRWGKDAEYIKAHPGSAVRNLKYMEETELVYSDTGTLGLSVRLLMPGQVFVASGPGIRIHEGNKFAHLAFLNSRTASYLLRLVSPKFTVAAGYIAKLPVPVALFQSQALAAWAKECATLKQSLLSRKLGNVEYTTPLFGAFESLSHAVRGSIREDLYEELRRLELEAKIEQHILHAYGFGEVDRNRIHEETGRPAFLLEEKVLKLSAAELDSAVAHLIGPACQFTSTNKRKRFGTEGVLEELSVQFECSPRSVLREVERHFPALRQVHQLYRDDLLHKAALYCLGYLREDWQGNDMATVDELSTRLRIGVPAIAHMEVEDWLQNRLLALDSKVFMDKPIIACCSDTISPTFTIFEKYMPQLQAQPTDNNHRAGAIG